MIFIKLIFSYLIVGLTIAGCIAIGYKDKQIQQIGCLEYLEEYNRR